MMDSTNISAYAAHTVGAPLEVMNYDPGPLQPDEVRLEVTHCGVCHSDISLIDNHHGMTAFPLIAGHEIVGKVTSVGVAVKHLKMGQRVGVGPFRSACLHCERCTRGFENLCADKQLTVLGHHGGFATAIQVPAAFAFPIPDGLASEFAAPLLCAGLTVYTPIVRNSTSNHRVGILGIGGLGHLAIQIASRRGSEVTVFSTSPGKADEARKFGAHHFVDMGDSTQMAAVAGSIDLLLSTTYASVKWSDHLTLLRPNGHLCIVGASMTPLDIPAAMLTLDQYTISGSAAGGRGDMLEMLSFCGRHGIAPQIERMPISEINNAVDRVRQRNARYRVVLEAA